jgi:outer membrane protein TolC
MLSGKETSTAASLGAAPSSMPSQLLTNRPDIVSAAASLAAADANLAAAASNRFPKFNLSSGLGLLAFSPSDLFETDSLVGSLVASIAGPLLDFGRVQAQIDGAAAGKMLAFETYRGAVFRALGEAEAAYGIIEAADEETRFALQESAAASRAADIADTRFRAGLSDFLTVLDARRAEIASADSAAAAIGRAQRARVVLWQALGGSDLGQNTKRLSQTPGQ